MSGIWSKLGRPLLLLTVMVAAFIFLSNPFHGIPGTDSSIFLYVARRMSEGMIPYLDVFDHKGPLIYFINWIAICGGWTLMRGSTIGLWILDIGCMVGVLFFANKIIVNYSGSCRAMVLSLLLVFYHFVGCGGNMPEQWIALFAIIAYERMIAGETIVGHRLKLNLIIIGLCCAAIATLKFNMLSILVPLVLVVSYKESQRLHDGIIYNLRAIFLWAGIGFAAGLLPFVFYFGTHDALDAVWEVYFKYNATYASARGEFFNVAFSRAFWPVFALLLINLWLWLRIKGEHRKVLWVNFYYLLAAWGLVIISGGSVRYYGPIIPAMVIPIGVVVEQISELNQKISPLICLVCISAIGGMVWLRNKDNRLIHAQYDEIRTLDLEMESNEVTVLGCDCWVYEVLGAKCPLRFPYQGTIAQCSSVYRQQILDDLKRGKSNYLIIPNGVLDTPNYLGANWAKEIVLSHYRMIASTARYELMEVK